MEKLDPIILQSAYNFKCHLEDSSNSRIIFSGIFGIGKTTFLSTIFNDEYQNELFSLKYNVFHLYPVNYSVASNEDIFKYIKYDLIYSLLDKKIEFIENDFSYLSEFRKYLGSNIHRVLAPLFLLLPVVGRDAFQLFSELNKLKDEFLLQCSKSKTDEGEAFYNYLSQIENTSGGLYELDIYTKFLNNVLKRIKDEGKKQNILIIDDLDRIDPAHLFRLMNVFAAHFDQRGNSIENKFDFDKIIFVCDINNVRNLFKNFYGVDVDFNGYIDKFYSTDIFHFSNYHYLEAWLTLTLKKSGYSSSFFSQRDIKFIYAIITGFLSLSKINFRSLLKNNLDRLEKKISSAYKRGEHKFFNLEITKVLILLSQLFGDAKSLILRLEEVIEIHINKSVINIGGEVNDVQQFYNCYIFPLITCNIHYFKCDVKYTYVKPDKMAYHFWLKNDGHNFVVKPEEDYPIANERFWIDIKKSVEMLHERGII